MHLFKKIYGKTTVNSENEETTHTIMLKYYKTKYNNFSQNDEKKYGVGIIKTEIVNNEINEEKQEFNHICKQKCEVEHLLSILLKNKVTPIDLKYVLEDMAI